jgi:hypothetical protein
VQLWRRTTAGVEARFAAAEVDIVRDLVEQLVTVLSAEAADDPVVQRLFPDGYRDDPKAAAELRGLIEDDLRQGKLAAARTVLESLAEGGRLVLTIEDAEQWLATLNDLRLALGTRLGVTQEDDSADDESDERAAELAVYRWLGYQQEYLLDALTAVPN